MCSVKDSSTDELNSKLGPFSLKPVNEQDWSAFIESSPSAASTVVKLKMSPTRTIIVFVS